MERRATSLPGSGPPPIASDARRARRFAVCCRELGRSRQALREFERLAEADATDVESLHQAAALADHLGPPLAAVRARVRLGERLSLTEHRLAALHQYRRALDGNAALRQAERLDLEVVTHDADHLRAYCAERKDALDAYSEAGGALERSGDDAEAADLYARMSAILSDNPGFHARRAEALCRAGRVDEAVPAFREAARTLVLLDRPTDALRVLERILHLRPGPEEAVRAAELYLRRNEPKDPVRAVTKLQPCLAADPESLPALAMLARAFEGMKQPARAIQVRVEMARLAREDGDIQLAQEIEAALRAFAPDDPAVRALLSSGSRVSTSSPEISYRDAFASVTEEDLEPLQDVIEEARSRSDGSVLENVSFEEVPEEWLLPVVSREARRALDDAETFTRLKLYPKALAVLRAAIESDPLCAELREAHRGLLLAQGDREGFAAETLVLADLYRQRRFIERARTLVSEILSSSPEHPGARAMSRSLDGGRAAGPAPSY